MGTTTVQELEQELIDRAGLITKRWGLSESSGRVFGALLISDEPMTQRALAKRAGYSLSLVSPSLRSLEEMGMVRASRSEGKERLYEPAVSLTEAFSILVARFVERDVKPLADALFAAGEKELSAKRSLMGALREYRRLEFVLNQVKNIMVMKRATEERLRELLR